MSSLLPGGNTLNPDEDIPDLSGKVGKRSSDRKSLLDSDTSPQHYIVTGGSAGIGFGIAAHLIQHNAENVTILSNKEDHAQSALEELKEFGDATKAHWVKCNLEDLAFTNRVADELASSQDRLDGASDTSSLCYPGCSR
jgi:FlaA1/EpsC-like NDP-sugar epimerase